MGAACSKKKREPNSIQSCMLINQKDVFNVYEGTLTLVYNLYVREVSRQKKNSL